MGKPRKGHALRPPSEHIGRQGLTEGSEPSQYLEEEKSIEIPSVAASERGRAQTGAVSAAPGLWDPAIRSYKPVL
jgi:hypothetical protein